jgi:hypothetical protein
LRAAQYESYEWIQRQEEFDAIHPKFSINWIFGRDNLASEKMRNCVESDRIIEPGGLEEAVQRITGVAG